MNNKHKKPPAKTQRRMVEEHLERLKSITTWEAIQRYRITRLSEYIRELREMGWIVNSTWENNNDKRWVRYHLERRPE